MAPCTPLSSQACKESAYVIIPARCDACRNQRYRCLGGCQQQLLMPHLPALISAGRRLFVYQSSQSLHHHACPFGFWAACMHGCVLKKTEGLYCSCFILRHQQPLMALRACPEGAWGAALNIRPSSQACSTMHVSSDAGLPACVNIY